MIENIELLGEKIFNLSDPVSQLDLSLQPPLLWSDAQRDDAYPQYKLLCSCDMTRDGTWACELGNALKSFCLDMVTKGKSWDILTRELEGPGDKRSKHGLRLALTEKGSGGISARKNIPMGKKGAEKIFQIWLVDRHLSLLPDFIVYITIGLLKYKIGFQ